MPKIVTIAAAIGLAAVGIFYGTYAAGGSDSSCYALMAESLASGHLQPSSALIAEVPWPDAQKTFTPGGFLPSQSHATGFAPVCAPGFSVLLAPVVKFGGANALFYVTPMAGALLVWLTYLAGSALAGPVAGAMGAVLVATSPAVLYQVVQPMNDITTAALWMAVFVGLMSRRFVVAGICCGLALLVRPNLLPLAPVAALYILCVDRRKVVPFAIAALPFALAVLGLNAGLYGGPLRSGYGTIDRLFGLSAVPTNVSQYVRWLIETQTPFPLLAFAAPFVLDRPRALDAWLAVALIAATFFIYFLYKPFDDWSYLRFLLPAITLMLVLASAVVVEVARRMTDNKPGCVSPSDRRTGRHQRSRDRPRRVWRTNRERPVRLHDARVGTALPQRGARRARSVAAERRRVVGVGQWGGAVPRPQGSARLGRARPGLVRSQRAMAGRRTATSRTCWSSRGRSQVSERGLVTPAQPESSIGPPKYEIDRVVRIYDPQDRAPYHRGDRVHTEYLWPLRP